MFRSLFLSIYPDRANLKNLAFCIPIVLVLIGNGYLKIAPLLVRKALVSFFL